MITSIVVLALGVMLANLLADILYTLLDPRIKLGA
jgi:peptide/nickel transport system permease protein